MNRNLCRIVALLLVLCVIPVTPALAISDSMSESSTDSSAINLDTDISTIASSISSVIADYYYSKDVSGVFVADTSFEEDIAAYLDNKVDVQQYVTDLYSTNKENYSVDVSLKGYTEDTDNSIIFFEFKVLTTFNYIGCDFDTSVCEVVEIQYNYKNDKIVDMYTPMNYYDEYVRAGESTATRSANAAEFELSSTIVEKQAKIWDCIDTRYSAVTSSDIAETAPQSVARASTLDSSAIVTWARNNYYKDQPSPGNSSVSYYDFSAITNAYDCTNFVSHAVLAGGAKIYDTGNSGISSTGWYYRSLSNLSSSWSGVNQFYQYMTTNTTSNTAAGDSYMYTHNGTWWGLGYVMQFDFNGDSDFDHSTIITVKSYSSDGERCYAYVTGRTGDDRYNDNQSADDMSPTYTPRVLFIYNN